MAGFVVGKSSVDFVFFYIWPQFGLVNYDQVYRQKKQVLVGCCHMTSCIEAFVLAGRCRCGCVFFSIFLNLMVNIMDI